MNFLRQFGGAFDDLGHIGLARGLQRWCWAMLGPNYALAEAINCTHLWDSCSPPTVWTAGVRAYAQAVIRNIDPNGVIDHCIYRHEKWFTGQVSSSPCSLWLRTYFAFFSLIICILQLAWDNVCWDWGCNWGLIFLHPKVSLRSSFTTGLFHPFSWFRTEFSTETPREVHTSQ